MGKTLFISDLHFGHKNVLRYDNRPFDSVEENDSTIINNWNSKVDGEDDVYILGDVSFGSVNKTIELLSAMNGRKHLIVGNHDHKALKNFAYRNCFVEIEKYLDLQVAGVTLVLCHYPILMYNHQYRGAYMFYGHVHNSIDYFMVKAAQDLLRNNNIKTRMLNVGCMEQNYIPLTLEECIEKVKKDEEW